LNPNNFHETVTPSVNSFVEFFAPWCGHCKSLEPEYEKFARAFANEEEVSFPFVFTIIIAIIFNIEIFQVVIARVDCDQHRELCSE
jgi:thiol-disulfide isomerase/thioredoxin